MNNKQIWDAIYRNYSPSKLPWYGLSFPPQIDKFLEKLDKSDLIIVVGCGAGDTAAQIYNKGFTNILGTDISSEAIELAKKRFPDIKFQCIATEDLYKQAYNDANIVDWLNLHQVPPTLLSKYLKSLNKLSKSLFLAYFYDPQRPDVQKSMITNGLIYNHKPALVKNLLKDMKKKE